MTRVRLFISDVDGTLVRSDKTLADATIAAVKRLQAAGVPMTLISARPPSGMYWLADALGIDQPMGAFNGGTLFRRDRSVIEAHRLPDAVAAETLALLDRPGVSRWVFADGQWFASDPDEPHVPRERRSASLDPVITQDFTALLSRIDKIVGVSDDHALLAGLEAEAQAANGAEATIARSQPYYLDVTHRAANKGDGVRFLADAIGVGLDAVAVAGDMMNDLPMFARAAISVAMGQAPEEVRRAATLGTASNDEDGLAAAIDQLILPRCGA